MLKLLVSRRRRSNFCGSVKQACGVVVSSHRAAALRFKRTFQSRSEPLVCVCAARALNERGLLIDSLMGASSTSIARQDKHRSISLRSTFFLLVDDL